MGRLGSRRWLLFFVALGLTASLLLINGQANISGALARRMGELLAPGEPSQTARLIAVVPTEREVPAGGPSLPAPKLAATAAAPGEAPARTPSPAPLPTATATQPARPTATAPATATATPTGTAPAPAAAPRPSPTPQPSRTPTKPAPSPAPTREGHAYYVDSVHGSDQNSGMAPDAAWQTLAPVNARKFGPGDVINLARGSSWAGGGADTKALRINGSGAPGNPITVQAYSSGSAPRLSNPAPIAPSANGAFGMAIYADYVTVQNLLFDNAGEAGIVIYGSHSLIQHNELTQAGTDLEVHAQYSLITHNYMHDNHLAADDHGAGHSWGGDGIMLNGSGNIEVAYNDFINCYGPMSIPPYKSGGAVEFYANNPNVFMHHNYAINGHEFSELGSEGGTDSNVTWAYNLQVNNGALVGLHVGGPFSTTFHGLRVINNTVIATDNGQSPYFFYKDGGNATGLTAGDLVVRNNIFYASGTNMTLDQNPEVPFTHDHNLYNGLTEFNVSPDGTEQNADPKFVNFAAGDYHLQAGSPAIGGALLPAPSSVDFDGCALPAGGFDIGAYQHRDGAAAGRRCG